MSNAQSEEFRDMNLLQTDWHEFQIAPSRQKLVMLLYRQYKRPNLDCLTSPRVWGRGRQWWGLGEGAKRDVPAFINLQENAFLA